MYKLYKNKKSIVALTIALAIPVMGFAAESSCQEYIAETITISMDGRNSCSYCPALICPRTSDAECSPVSCSSEKTSANSVKFRPVPNAILSASKEAAKLKAGSILTVNNKACVVKSAKSLANGNVEVQFRSCTVPSK